MRWRSKNEKLICSWCLPAKMFANSNWPILYRWISISIWLFVYQYYSSLSTKSSILWTETLTCICIFHCSWSNGFMRSHCFCAKLTSNTNVRTNWEHRESSKTLLFAFNRCIALYIYIQMYIYRIVNGQLLKLPNMSPLAKLYWFEWVLWNETRCSLLDFWWQNESLAVHRETGKRSFIDISVHNSVVVYEFAYYYCIYISSIRQIELQNP